MYIIKYWDNNENKMKYLSETTYGGAWGAARAVKNAGHLGVELYEQIAEGLL